MKTAILFYSYTGNTRKWAKEKSLDFDADLLELRDQRPRSTLNAYILGSFAAMRRKCAKLMPLTCDLGVYDQLILAVPLWAGRPAPAFNNMLAMLPTGKRVDLVLVSASGSSKSSEEQTRTAVKNAGCTVTGYTDIRR